MNREQLKKLERDLWAAADKLRANSDLKASEYSTPVLGLIFLKFADNKYRQHEDTILAEYSKLKGTRRERSLQDIAIEKCGFALGPQARYDHLLNLPEKEDIPKAIRSAMATEGVGYTSICELGVHYPEDLDESHYEFASELPTIDPARDGAMVSNMPCLSHVTFKLVDKRAVELTAIYRSHWYLQRALGNLIGLSHLQSFIAKEAGLQIGSMTCISTDATLDYGSWGGVTEGRRRIAALLGD